MSGLKHWSRTPIGFDEERGDSVTVKSAEFVDTLMAAAVPWYEKSWFEEVSRQITTILILSIVALGVMRPLLSRILVPVGAVPPGMAASVGDEDLDIDTVEVGEGESLEDIKASLSLKRQQSLLRCLIQPTPMMTRLPLFA